MQFILGLAIGTFVCFIALLISSSKPDIVGLILLCTAFVLFGIAAILYKLDVLLKKMKGVE
jgi:hypothetical protein